MTIDQEDQLEALKAIGTIVADVLRDMGAALEPGMTTAELDGIGRRLLDEKGARSAPELCYGFPGATCISIGQEVAHGVPGKRVIAAGDLINIDVSAEKNGVFADTGASFAVPPVRSRDVRLMRDGKRALWAGIKAVRAGESLGGIGRSIERFADRQGYTLIRNLASHGVGRSLHEEPSAIPTWWDPREHRRIEDGMVFTIEPFLSTGSEWASEGDDGWTLLGAPGTHTVQFEHTLVATSRGAVVVTLPSS
jgi:methionyl aminopeptidase